MDDRDGERLVVVKALAPIVAARSAAPTTHTPDQR